MRPAESTVVEPAEAPRPGRDCRSISSLGPSAGLADQGDSVSSFIEKLNPTPREHQLNNNLEQLASFQLNHSTYYSSPKKLDHLPKI